MAFEAGSPGSDHVSGEERLRTPYGLIALLTYVVLDHTGIGRRHFTGDSQTFQQALNGMVSLLRLPCDDQTFGGEGKETRRLSVWIPPDPGQDLPHEPAFSLIDKECALSSPPGDKLVFP